jgi:peptide/nickel transport system substrate-binding protein
VTKVEGSQPTGAGEAKSALKRPVTRRRFIALSGASAMGLLVADMASTAATARRTPGVGRNVTFDQSVPPDLPPNQTAVIGAGSAPNGMNIDFSYAPRSRDIRMNCGIQALRYGPKANGVVNEADFNALEGWAAKEWDVNDDATKITITLKEGIMSSVGNELTADDVIWTFQRHWGLNLIPVGFERDLLGVDGPEDFVKEGKYTYSINVRAPNVILEPLMAHIEMQIVDSVEYQKHVTADDPWAKTWSDTNFIGHGPFKVSEYIPDESFTMVPNENYFAKDELTGNVTTIITRNVPDSSTRLALLSSGDIDLGLDFLASELKQAEQNGLRLDSFLGNYTQWLGFTFENELADLNVRKAIMSALPLDEIVERPYLGLATQMDSMVAPIYPGYDVIHTAWQKPANDINQAKQFMSQSAHPDGFTTTLHFDSAVAGQEETATIIKSALAPLGINVDIVKMTTQDYFQFAYAVGGGFPGLFLYLDFAGTPDPLFATGLFVVTDHCCSPGKYGNAEVDKLYDEAQSTLNDPNHRFDLQHQIEDIIFNKDPMGVPLHFLGFHAASSQKFQGWQWGELQHILYSKAIKL